jgi:hypothetical protein
MNDVIAITGTIRRRFILERDPPVNFAEALTEIRRLRGYGTSDLCFILNVPRPTLSSWEHDGCMPRYEHGRAILKLLSLCRNSDA